MNDRCFYDISNVKTQDKNEYPEFIAKFYDDIYNKIRSETDLKFYLDEISKCKGNILEVGVGTGRIFFDALKSGADIYGIDVSPSMINQLRNKLSDENQNRIFIKDVKEMNLGIQFDLIIAPFRVFQHLLHFDDQIKTLNNIQAHLKPNGLFIFDVFIPDDNIINKGANDTFEIEIDRGLLQVNAISVSDKINQISDVTFKFTWDNGKKADEWNTKIRYYNRYELENLIRLSKLQLENIYGDFSGGELNNDSKDFILICKNNPIKNC